MTSVFADDHQVDLGPGLYLRHATGQETPILSNIHGRRPGDRAGTWLRVAMGALAVLAATAAVVSYQAQFRLIMAYKSVKLIAALQAGIPDVAALVFAALGIALALHGKRAIRARLLNVAAVGTSIGMNALAASSGWKAMAVWTLAPIAYAVTSDTLIGVLRAYTIARQREMNEALADDEATPLAVLGKVVLYGTRLVISPISTLRGLRRALLLATPLPGGEDSPVAPAVTVPTTIALPQLGPVEAVKALPAPSSSPRTARSKPKRKSAKGKSAAKPGKGAALIQLAVDSHGLADLPLEHVSSLATRLAPEVDLHPSTARRVLLNHARSLQNGGEGQ